MSIPAVYLLRERGEFGGTGLPILTVVSEYGVRVRDLDAGGRAIGEDLNGYRRVRTGDLVVNRLWARFGAYGVSEFDGLISPAYWVLVPDASQVDGRFLHSLLRSSKYLAEIRRLSKDMPPNGFDLPWDLFKRVSINLPSLATQHAIADYLDRETARIDSVIEKKRRLLHLVDLKHKEFERQAIFQSGQPLIPLRWFMSIGSGMNLNNEDLVEDGCTLVVGGNGKIGLTNQKSMIEEKSVVIGRVGALCGNVHLVEPPTWITDNALLMTNLKSLTPDYLAVVLRAMDINSLANKTAQPLITGETIKSLAVPIPGKQKQLDLVRELDIARNRNQDKKRIIEAQIELFVERRNALIAAAVTGELKISEVAP